MRRCPNIYSLTWLLLLVLVSGCSLRPPSYKGMDEGKPDDTKVEMKFDPLGLPQDTITVTVANSAAEKKLLATIVKTDSSSSSVTKTSGSVVDSLNHQVYRVQLLMVDSYSDARKAFAIAEEIFDQPVSLNYDLPYYKVRVGEFATKAQADQYLARAKTAGYDKAWVVLANIDVKEIKPLYNTQAQPQPTQADSGSTNND
jgi:hypothetical protein